MFGEFTLNRLVDSILSEEGKKSGEFGLTKKADNALDEILKFVAGEDIQDREELEYLRFKIYHSIHLFGYERRKLRNLSGENSHGRGSYYATHVLWVARTFRKLGFDGFLTADVLGHDDIEYIEKRDQTEVSGYRYFKELDEKAKRYFKERNKSCFSANPLDIEKLPRYYRQLTWELTRDQTKPYYQEIREFKDIRTRRIREIVQIAKGIDILHNLMTCEFRPMNRDFAEYAVNWITGRIKKSYERRADTYGIDQQRLKFVTSRIYDREDLSEFLRLFLRRMAARRLYGIAEMLYGKRIDQESQKHGIVHVNRHEISPLYEIAFDLERFITLELPQKVSVRSKVIDYLVSANNYRVGVDENGKQGNLPPNTPELAILNELHDMIANEARRMFEDALHDVEKYWVSHPYIRELWEKRDILYRRGEFHRLTLPSPGDPFGGTYLNIIIPATSGEKPITSDRQDLNAAFLVDLITLSYLVQGRDPITKRQLIDPETRLPQRYFLVLKKPE